MPEPAPANPAGLQRQQTKVEKAKEMASKAKVIADKNLKEHGTYGKLIFVDGVTCVIHVLFWLILSMPFLMWITLLGIRVPRMILNFLSVKEQKANDGVTKYQKLECLFRYYTTLGYFPLAWFFQLISCLAFYCTDGWGVTPKSMLLRMLQAKDADAFEEWETESPGQMPETIPEPVRLAATINSAGNWNTSACKTGYMIWITIFLILNSGMDYYIWSKIVAPHLQPKLGDGTDKPPTAPKNDQPAEMQPVGKAPQTAYQDPAMGHDMT